MSPENFSYWLNGYLELSNSDSLTSQQVKIIKEHLALVFNKVTPSHFQGVLSSNSNLYPVQNDIIVGNLCAASKKYGFPVSC